MTRAEILLANALCTLYEELGNDDQVMKRVCIQELGMSKSEYNHYWLEEE